MTVPESIMIGLLCMAGVFLALVCLCFLIKLFSVALGSISNNSGKKNDEPASEPIFSQKPAAAVKEDFSSGNLILTNVDEPTAAMIMAIVSHESGIPLSELCFKSIKLISQD